MLPKSLAELTEAIFHQGRIAEALALAPRAGLAEKFRYEAMFAKLKALLKIPESESGKFRKRLNLENGDLFWLNLGELSISDLSPLHGLPIHSLHLASCRNVSDLSPLKNLPLDSLTIQGTNVSDLSPLRGMKLKEIMAADNKIADLSPLAGMPLTNVDLHATEVSSATPLAGMPLKKLDLRWCYAASDLRPLDFSPLKRMPLETLFLENTNVTNISALIGMPLRELLLGGTKVRDVSMLAGLTTLGVLRACPGIEASLFSRHASTPR